MWACCTSLKLPAYCLQLTLYKDLFLNTGSLLCHSANESRQPGGKYDKITTNSCTFLHHKHWLQHCGFLCHPSWKGSNHSSTLQYSIFFELGDEDYLVFWCPYLQPFAKMMALAVDFQRIRKFMKFDWNLQTCQTAVHCNIVLRFYT